MGEKGRGGERNEGERRGRGLPSVPTVPLFVKWLGLHWMGT